MPRGNVSSDDDSDGSEWSNEEALEELPDDRRAVLERLFASLCDDPDSEQEGGEQGEENEGHHNDDEDNDDDVGEGSVRSDSHSALDAAAYRDEQTFTLAEMQRLRRRFEPFDDTGGMQFRQFVRHVGPILRRKVASASLADVAVLFKRVDANANGSVDWFEMSEFLLMNDVKASLKATNAGVHAVPFARAPVTKRGPADHPATRYLYHSQAANRLLVSARHGRYYTAGPDGLAKMWSPDTLRHLRTFHCTRCPVVDMCLAARESTVNVLSMDGTFSVYSAESGEPQRVYKAARKREAAVLHGGRRVADDRRTFVSRPTFAVPISASELDEIRFGAAARVFGKVSACAPHLSHLLQDEVSEATALENLGYVPRGSGICGPRAGLSTVHYDGIAPAHLTSAGYVTSAAVLGERMDRPQMATFGLQSGHVQLYALDQAAGVFGMPLAIPNAATFAVHSAAVSRIRVCDTMNFLFTGSDDGTLQVRHWDRVQEYGVTLGRGVLEGTAGGTTSTIVDTAARGHTRRVTGLDWSLRSRLLCSCAPERDALLWSPYLPKPVMRLEAEGPGHTVDVSFCPDTNTLLTLSSSRVVRLWDLRTYRCVSTLQDPAPERAADELRAAVYDKNARAVVLASTTVRQWPAERQTKYGPQYSGHRSAVVGVAISAQFAQLITADEHLVLVWSLDDMREIVRFAISEGITSITLDANGRRLCVATQAGTVLVYNYVNGQLLKTCDAGPQGEGQGGPGLEAHLPTAKASGPSRAYDRPWLAQPAEDAAPPRETTPEQDEAHALKEAGHNAAPAHALEVREAEQLILRRGRHAAHPGEVSFVYYGEQALPRRTQVVVACDESGAALLFADEEAHVSRPIRRLDVTSLIGAARCVTMLWPASLFIGGAGGHVACQMLEDAAARTLRLPQAGLEGADPDLEAGTRSALPTGPSLCLAAVFAGPLDEDPVPAMCDYMLSRAALLMGGPPVPTSTGAEDFTDPRGHVTAPSVDCITHWAGRHPLVFTGSSDGVVQIWSGRTLREVLRFRAALVPGDGVTCIAVSGNGTQLFVGDAGGYLAVLDLSRFLDANDMGGDLMASLRGPAHGRLAAPREAAVAGVSRETVAAFASIGTVKGVTDAVTLQQQERRRRAHEAEQELRSAVELHTADAAELHVSAGDIHLVARFLAHDSPVTSIAQVGTDDAQGGGTMLRHARSLDAYARARDSPNALPDGEDTPPEGRTRYLFSGGEDSFVLLWDVAALAGIACVGDPQHAAVVPERLCPRAAETLAAVRAYCLLELIHVCCAQQTRRLRGALAESIRAARSQRALVAAAAGETVAHGRRRRVRTKRQEVATEEAAQAREVEQYRACRCAGVAADDVVGLVTACIAQAVGVGVVGPTPSTGGGGGLCVPLIVPTEAPIIDFDDAASPFLPFAVARRVDLSPYRDHLVRVTAAAFREGVRPGAEPAVAHGTIREMLLPRRTDAFLVAASLRRAPVVEEATGDVSAHLPAMLQRGAGDSSEELLEVNAAFERALRAATGGFTGIVALPPPADEHDLELTFAPVASTVTPDAHNATNEGSADEPTTAEVTEDAPTIHSAATPSSCATPIARELSIEPLAATERCLSPRRVARAPRCLASPNGRLAEAIDQDKSLSPRELERLRNLRAADSGAFDVSVSSTNTQVQGLRLLVGPSRTPAGPLSVGARASMLAFRSSQSAFDTAIEGAALQSALVCSLLMRFGTNAQKAKFLPRMVSDAAPAPWRGVFCLAEPGLQDVFAVQTVAAVPAEAESILTPEEKLHDAHTALRAGHGGILELTGTKVCLAENDPSSPESIAANIRGTIFLVVALSPRPGDGEAGPLGASDEDNGDAAPADAEHRALTCFVVDGADAQRYMRFGRSYAGRDRRPLVNVSMHGVPIAAPALQVLGRIGGGRAICTTVMNELRLGVPPEPVTEAVLTEEMARISFEILSASRLDAAALPPSKRGLSSGDVPALLRLGIGRALGDGLEDRSDALLTPRERSERHQLMQEVTGLRTESTALRHRDVRGAGRSPRRPLPPPSPRRQAGPTDVASLAALVLEEARRVREEVALQRHEPQSAIIWDTSDRDLAALTGEKGIVISHDEDRIGERLRQIDQRPDAVPSAAGESFTHSIDFTTAQSFVHGGTGTRDSLEWSSPPELTPTHRPEEAPEDAEVLAAAEEYLYRVLGTRLSDRHRIHTTQYVHDAAKRRLLKLPAHAVSTDELRDFQRTFVLSKSTEADKGALVAPAPPAPPTATSGSPTPDWLDRIHTSVAVHPLTEVPKPRAPHRPDGAGGVSARQVLAVRETAWLRLLTTARGRRSEEASRQRQYRDAEASRRSIAPVSTANVPSSARLPRTTSKASFARQPSTSRGSLSQGP